MGRLIAEYTSGNATGSGTNYITADVLGSPRVITAQDKSVKARHDYLPFGEEIPAGYGSRTAQQGYVADNLRQKFTGKERDIESGLDYFSARYYSSPLGRFNSADSMFGSIGNPQTLNRYAYTLNNPLKYVDPTGHDPSAVDDVDYYDDERQQESHNPERTVYIFILFRVEDQKTQVPANNQTGAPALTVDAPPFRELLKAGNVNLFTLDANIMSGSGEAPASKEALSNALADPNGVVVIAGHTEYNGSGEVSGLFGLPGSVDGGGPTSAFSFNGVKVESQALGVFACESDKMLSSTMPNAGQSIITVNSGSDGATSTGALSRAAFATASSLARGVSVDAAVQGANAALTPTTTRKAGSHPIILSRTPIDIGDQVRKKP